MASSILLELANKEMNEINSRMARMAQAQMNQGQWDYLRDHPITNPVLDRLQQTQPPPVPEVALVLLIEDEIV